MIIVHENLEREALSVARTLEEAFGVNARVIPSSLENVFLEFPEVGGYHTSDHRVIGFLRDVEGIGQKEYAMILTLRDIFSGNQKEDDWIIACVLGRFSVVSTARLNAEAPELYLARINHMAVHEVGHNAVRAGHFLTAYWVNSETGHQQSLGPHCDDNRCVMYEVVDLKAPKPEEGYLLLGNERRYDAGLDDMLARRYPDWFCSPCRESLALPEENKTLGEK